MRSGSPPSMIRPPAVAGTFYPDSAEALAHQVDSYLEEAIIEPLAGSPIAIIVPHAGYIFSGWVAAYAYKAIIGMHFDTVILVGLCHSGLDGISVYDTGGYETPLGVVEIDSELARKIIEFNPKIIKSLPKAHLGEHSLEVQIPFLQRSLQDFKIIPILIDDSRYSPVLAEAITHSIKNRKGKTLLIGSTDLTHYPRYEDAKRIDKTMIDAILSRDPNQLDKANQIWMNKGIPNLHCTICSEAAVKTVLYAANALGANNSITLKSANSGDVPIGDRYQVVGYAAIALMKIDADAVSTPIYNEIKEEAGTRASDKFTLSESAQKELLRIARETLTAHVKGNDISKITSNHQELNQHLGAFVTLTKRGELRGCIGRFEPDSPVKEIVRDLTVSSASEDPRFPPVTANELKDMQIEISVLTPRKKINNIKEIEIGKHGLYISKGWYAGTLLPQVATEYNWNVEAFLHHTCIKAGLPPLTWKDKDTEIFIYSAVIFHEESPSK